MRPVLSGAPQPAEWLGAGPSALYLITRSGSVLAIVTHDAVRLPCALVLASTAAERPLTELAPSPAHRVTACASVGAGRVEWTGRSGPVTIAGAREWAAAVVGVGSPLPARLDALLGTLATRDIGVDAERIARLGCAGRDSAAQYAAVAGLLGRGCGLTPSGDDVVAGYLLGARAFGLPVPGATAAVLALAGDATTALSAQLLRHAVRGECVRQFATVLDELTGGHAPHDALDRLLAVGHTSGTALAAGLCTAAALSVPSATGGVE
ncbi:MAG: DUF2877 domain-containing protein [Pseudonocardiales bacterium]